MLAWCAEGENAMVAKMSSWSIASRRSDRALNWRKLRGGEKAPTFPLFALCIT